MWCFAQNQGRYEKNAHSGIMKIAKNLQNLLNLPSDDNFQQRPIDSLFLKTHLAMWTPLLSSLPERRNSICLRQAVDSGANGLGEPEALPGTVNRLRAKVQRSQFPAERFGCCLPALTAFCPNRIDDVGQLPAEDLRSPVAMATRQETFQNDRCKLSRGVKTKVPVALVQKLDETDLQIFVVGNTATQRPRHVLHRGCQFAHIDFGGTNCTEVCQPILQQFGLKLIRKPFTDTSPPKTEPVVPRATT